MASAISSAERDPAPSSSIAAARLATPYFPGGSLAVPLRTTRLICATGTLCSSTTQTGRPLDSFCFWMAGRCSGAGGPGCGGCERSGACAVSAIEAQIAAITTNGICLLIWTLVGADPRVGPGGHIGPPLRFLRGLDGQLDALVERQELGRRGADVADRQRAIPRDVFVEPV